eukprot:4839265-Amphidinium_carterae.3
MSGRQMDWCGFRQVPSENENYWFDGRGYWLNQIWGEKLSESDDELNEEERAEMQCAAEDGGWQTQQLQEPQRRLRRRKQDLVFTVPTEIITYVN